MSEYLKMFVSFFKIGVFTFGGGYAMLPMFRKELIEKNEYITEEELMDYYSIGQCTPGIIAVNVATFTGYKVRKTMGAVVATASIILPSLIIIMAIAGLLDVITNNGVIEHAFNGIRIGVTVLLFNELINIAKKNIKSKFQVGVLIFAILLLLLGSSSIMAVFLAALVGFFRFWRIRK